MKAAVGRTVKTVEPLDNSSVEKYPLLELTENSGSRRNYFDSRATVSLISEETYNQFLRCFPKKSTVKLKFYSGEEIPCSVRTNGSVG